MEKSPGFSKGFSLVETLVAASAAVVVGLAVFTIFNTGMILTARNLSVNLTSNKERDALDRIEQMIQQANIMPVLIDTSGNPASSPSAGTSFDWYKGGPYVITASGSTIPASTTSLTIQRSTNVVACPPVPGANDVLMVNGAPTSIRALISSSSVGTTNSSQQQSITVNFASALGTAIPVPSNGILTATIVRKIALIVMPSGSNQQLRLYNSYETTTNLNDPTKYILLTDQIGIQSGDTTPFSLTQIQSANFVSLSLRVRSNVFDQRLNGHQADQFNTFARIDSFIRPKINP